jgi:hypothetical protein
MFQVGYSFATARMALAQLRLKRHKAGIGID